MTDLTVACFLWSDPARQRSYQFGREDVRIWDSMIARHLIIPHRRICVTHRPDLVGDFIETLPIDPEKHVPGLCTVKLQAHKPGGIAKEGDRVLLMDIDCIVIKDLSPLLTGKSAWRSMDIANEPSFWWHNPNYKDYGRRGYIQGSMQLFTVGATEQLWRDFDPKSTPGWLNRRFGGGEQAWISERLNVDYPNPGWAWTVPTWSEHDGVYGAGRLVDGTMGAGVQSELPANAKIVFTPGDRSPSQPEMQAKHPWIKEFYR